MTRQFQFADLLAVHFVRTVGKSQGARGRVSGGQRKVIADAAAAMHLDCPIDDLESHGGRGNLDHGDLLLGGAVAHRVHHIGGIQHQPAGLIDQNPRFGDALERHPLLRDALAEGDALLGALAQQLQRPFGQADQTHAMVDAPRPEPPLCNLKAASFTQQKILHRHAHVDEIDLRMAMRRVIVAEHMQLTQPPHAGRVHGHENHGLLAVQPRFGVGLAHEYQDLAARIAGAGSPPFAAVDHVVSTVAHDRGLDVRGIARCDVGLGHRKGRANAALQQRHQPTLLLLRRRIAGQYFHVAGIGRRAIERLRREMRTPHDLAQRRVLQIGEAGAVLGMRQKKIPQILRPGFALQFLHDCQGLPGIAAAPVLLHLLVEARLRRIDVGIHEGADLLLQKSNLVAVRKIHSEYPLSTKRRTIAEPTPTPARPAAAPCGLPRARSRSKHCLVWRAPARLARFRSNETC